MRSVSVMLVVFMVVASSVRAAPTPEQQQLISGCGVMAQAVLEFALARDQGLSKPDAFKSVTHGRVIYTAGSPVVETEDWAYGHPDEQAITAAAHFHGRCVLDAWELLTPIAESQLASAAQACQREQADKPNEIRSCIDGKALAMVAAVTMPTPEATAVAVPPPATQASEVAMAAAPAAVAIAPVPAPPPAVVPVAPALAASAPRVKTPAAQPTPQPVVAKAVVPAPQPLPEPTRLAAAPPSATRAREVAMAAIPAGAVIAPVSSPPPAVIPPAPAAPAPVVVATVSAPPPEVAVPEPVPEATIVTAAPPSATQVPEVAMAEVSAIGAIAPVSAPPPAFVPPAPLAPTAIASTPVEPAPVTPIPVPEVATPVPVAPVSVARAAAPVVAAPTPDAVPQLTVASSLPASLAGIDKLSVGMSMDDAIKALGSHGEEDTDQQGNPARSFLISDGHGYIELITEAGKPEVVYGIEYHGGADAKVPPILGVRLGDGAADVLTRVGEPTSRSPAPFDRTLWTYEGRNYSFEISSGGDLITIRIAGDAGLTTPATSDSSPPPSSP